MVTPAPAPPSVFLSFVSHFDFVSFLPVCVCVCVCVCLSVCLSACLFLVGNYKVEAYKTGCWRKSITFETGRDSTLSPSKFWAAYERMTLPYFRSNGPNSCKVGKRKEAHGNLPTFIKFFDISRWKSRQVLDVQSFKHSFIPGKFFFYEQLSYLFYSKLLTLEECKGTKIPPIWSFSFLTSHCFKLSESWVHLGHIVFLSTWMHKYFWHSTVPKIK